MVRSSDIGAGPHPQAGPFPKETLAAVALIAGFAPLSARGLRGRDYPG